MDRTSSFPSAILSAARRFTPLQRPGCCGNDIPYPWSYGRHLVDADSVRPEELPDYGQARSYWLAVPRNDRSLVNDRLFTFVRRRRQSASPSRGQHGQGGAIQFHSAPGNHFTMLRRPNVRVIAEVLQNHMFMVGGPQRRISARSAGIKLPQVDRHSKSAHTVQINPFLST